MDTPGMPSASTSPGNMAARRVIRSVAMGRTVVEQTARPGSRVPAVVVGDLPVHDHHGDAEGLLLGVVVGRGVHHLVRVEEDEVGPPALADLAPLGEAETGAGQ